MCKPVPIYLPQALAPSPLLTIHTALREFAQDLASLKQDSAHSSGGGPEVLAVLSLWTTIQKYLQAAVKLVAPRAERRILGTISTRSHQTKVHGHTKPRSKCPLNGQEVLYLNDTGSEVTIMEYCSGVQY